MLVLEHSVHDFKKMVPQCAFLQMPSALVAIASLLLCVILVRSQTSASDLSADTLYYHNRPPNVQGDFHFEFQTSNGITTKAAGNTHGFSGVVQYVSKEGIPVTMTYVADADGYHPDGEHIPRVPEYIERALEYIRSHEPVNEKESRAL